MQSARSYLDQQTAEAQADNARFNYYVASGLVYNEGEREGQPVFRDLDDYLEHAGEPHAVAAATELMKLLMGDDWRRKLPEYAFLLKYGFVDEQLRLIDPRSKKLIDTEGRPINEKGFLLNEAGEPVNEQGDRIDEEGNLLFEGEPEFTDDDGDAEAASKSEGEKAPSPLQAV